MLPAIVSCFCSQIEIQDRLRFIQTVSRNVYAMLCCLAPQIVMRVICSFEFGSTTAGNDVVQAVALGVEQAVNVTGEDCADFVLDEQRVKMLGVRTMLHAVVGILAWIENGLVTEDKH